MRYAVISKGLSVSDIETRCRQVGAESIRTMPRLHQVYCELDADAIARLHSSGLIVKALKTVRPAQVSAPLVVEETELSGLSFDQLLAPFREAFSPPLTGTGLTVAVLDTGISSTHQATKSSVIYNKNFSDSETTEDIYDHGSAVASCILGISPGVGLINLKVLGDNGEGNEEDLVAAIEEVCKLREQSEMQALPLTDPEFVNLINLSLGTEDDADPDNPVRLACKSAIDDYKLDVIAACGNAGEKMSSILIPAVEPSVIAVGGLTSDLLRWEYSGKGPTLNGEIKPDFMFYGVGIKVASIESDTSYKVKSGTSFSAPGISGLTGLIEEVARRSYGENYYLSWLDIEKFAPFVCIKPESQPIDKDCEYGYGLPLAGRLVPSVAAAPTNIVTDMLPLIVMMPMLMLSRSMAKR